MGFTGRLQKLTLSGQKLTPCGTDSDPLILHALKGFGMVNLSIKLIFPEMNPKRFQKARSGGQKLYYDGGAVLIRVREGSILADVNKAFYTIIPQYL